MYSNKITYCCFLCTAHTIKIKPMSEFENASIKFPFYKNDGKPLFIFKRTIKEAVIRVNDKIKSGKYKHIPNPCLCGNQTPENDLLIAEKDMWGIAVDSLICSRCGLVRSKTIQALNSNTPHIFFCK